MAQEEITVVQIEEIARRVVAEEMESLRREILREMQEQAGYGPEMEPVGVVLRELAHSHARAEGRLAGVEAALEALARAQVRTEEEFRQYREVSEARFARIEAALDRLAEAQARTEERVTRLEEAVARLIEAQARTEERVTRLEEAVARLIEAQARTEEELRQYREASEARFARIEAALDRLAEAQARTEEEFRQYREASEARFARIEAALDRLTEAQARTEKRVEELAEAQARTEKRVDELAQAQARTEQTLQALIAAHQKLEVRVGRMDGELLEIRYERRATAYFGRILRRVRVVEVAELLDTLEARLTPEEVDEVLNLDLLVVGRPRRPGAMPEEREVWLAVEISATVDTEDVERAAERAMLLRKAGYAAIPAVAGREATSIAEEAAQEQGALLIRDGRVDFWDQALTRWRE